MNNTKVGLDFGNGFVKLAINGKASKIPAAYSVSMPTSLLSPTTGKPMKPKTFSLSYGEKTYWFGEAALRTGDSIREIDAHKFNDAEHIQIIFAAALANHVKAHKIDPEAWGRLSIATSLPPSAYADMPTRAKAIKAYEAAFAKRSAPWYVRSSIVDTFRISTEFAGMYQEAATLAQTMKLNRLTLFGDLGYGTLDLVLVDPRRIEPVFAKSFNVGLAHAFEKLNPINTDRAEYDLLTDAAARSNLAAHFSTIKGKLSLALRHAPGADLVLIGGGTKLMPPSVLSGFKAMAPTVRVMDEYSNARANEQATGLLI